MRESGTIWGGTIWYRGAGYQLGRGQHGYAIWPAAGPLERPLEQWPETPAGWSAAWSRFNAVEAPGTIVHLGAPAAPFSGPPVARRPSPPAAVPGPLRPAAGPGSWRSAGGSSGPAAGPAWSGIRSAGPLTAAILLMVGVACGLAGLFPGYLSGTSLAQEPPDLVPHVIYLAVWTGSALLIASGGTRQRMGALLALGMSIVTFGLFFADLGTVISGGAHLLGPGLVLSLRRLAGLTAGAVVALRLRSADAPRRLDVRQAGPAAMLASRCPRWAPRSVRAFLGPLHAADGGRPDQSLTAGNSFANPGPVIAGDVAVMVALVLVVAVAALWRPVRLGAVLLAGAAIPMVAQAISALIQVTSRCPRPASASRRPRPRRPGSPSAQGSPRRSGSTACSWWRCSWRPGGCSCRSAPPAGPPGSTPAPAPLGGPVRHRGRGGPGRTVRPRPGRFPGPGPGQPARPGGGPRRLTAGPRAAGSPATRGS